MATTHGVDGDMGHGKMTDEETYRELVRTTCEHQEHFANYVMNHSAEKCRKRLIWLRLMGLIETWYNT